MKCSKILIGIGNMMVELCSAEMLLRVCRYLSWKMFVNQTPADQKTSCHSHLEGWRTLWYDLCCLSQSSARFLFPLSSDHLRNMILISGALEQDLYYSQGPHSQLFSQSHVGHHQPTFWLLHSTYLLTTVFVSDKMTDHNFITRSAKIKLILKG